MLIKLLALDKWARFFKIIVKNGGILKSTSKLWKHDTLKDGTYVGTDSLGNKYYENNYYMIARSRWVEYNPNFNFEYDASQVSAEWYGWLHYKTDRLPSQDCAKHCLMTCGYVQSWLQQHEENLTGTDKAFYPYSTVRSHIKVWNGACLCESVPDCPDTTNKK
ncbi:probable NADH dehydrogenase [ubiquinone] 1 alpha subcomplex subunit 12 [Danaus plexippus]|uniref:NADH dehydrogenase [ubiquinone] 1 alpha subcomplex subunit 12 n=1 Tax=Danaus plexippus plexippus TaxID=278856 RepID=A0A212F9S5_DANPL|nr:probable NADH dehydrogenase [ubiquinone] 1 alpha subcomplex subunit 12 [Danaus plexippus]OWR50478.1 NADH dehydrogenase [Danaus plexippus plexippus]